MAEVYNWHLGRSMDYRHEAGATQRQFAAVFNINRCIACQTCTMACKSTWTHSPGQELMWWNNVETKPYGSYPRDWDVKALGLLEEANPGGQSWNGVVGDARAPYGRFDGVTVFEATDGFSERALGYTPTEEEWKAPNRFEDHATRFPANDVLDSRTFSKTGRSTQKLIAWNIQVLSCPLSCAPDLHLLS